MQREFSIYLDLIRFLAAALVLVHHSNFKELSQQHVWFSEHGPAAVIVFFVLSGYVISYVSVGKEREPLDYWSSRLSRFYSLAVPIVLFCPLLDWMGASMGPQFYDGGRTTHDLAFLRILTSLAFVNEVWTMAIMSFSNVPYWSLNYEMWYYIMFAVVAFTRGRARVALLTAAVLFVGPKIVLLAPVWMLGVLAHRWDRLRSLPSWTYWLMFCVSWPLYFIYIHYNMAEIGSDLTQRLFGTWWQTQLSFSKYFLTDYVLALVVLANFVGFRGIAEHFRRPLMAVEKPIRWLAGYTFSLYILHQPLLQFFGALINGDPSGRLFHVEVLGATLLAVVLISSVTEQQRHHLKRWVRDQLSVLTAMPWWQAGVSARLGAQRVNT